MFYQPFKDGWVDAVYDMRAKARGEARSPDNRELTVRHAAKWPVPGANADYLAIYLAAYNTVERGYIAGWHFGQPDTERFDLSRAGDAR